MRKHGGFTRLDAGRGGGKAGPPDLGRLPAGASFIRGGVLPEIGWFSSTRAEKAGRRDLCSKAMTPLTWPYACRLFTAAKCEEREAPSEEPSVDENYPISGRSPPVFLPRKLTEGCRLHGQVRASESSDTYAWAVMSVGPDALLFGESIIAMLGLAPTNPTRMFVATPRRTRRKLPNSIKVEWLRGIKPTATYNGIPCQSAQNA